MWCVRPQATECSANLNKRKDSNGKTAMKWKQFQIASVSICRIHCTNETERKLSPKWNAMKEKTDKEREGAHERKKKKASNQSEKVRMT